MEVMRAAEALERSGTPVLHLEVGQPSTPAPSGVLAAATSALGLDKLGYTGAAGLPELRQRIAQWYEDYYQLTVTKERIVVTTGASGSCVLTFLALFDPGQRVAVLEPGYPCYRNDLLAFGIDVVTIPVGPETSFRPTVAQLEAAGQLDGLVIASPSNPTGTVLDDSQLAELMTWTSAEGVQLIADEIYHGITYDQSAPTALRHDPDVVVINSFSKFFSMTGWRLGWVVANPEVAEAVERLAQSLTVAPPTLSQIGGIAAFDCIDELNQNVARYEQNRRILLDGLSSAGIDRLAPADGAFYVWADVAHLCDDSQDLCQHWLDELAVATTPGLDFDQPRGHQFVRFSYAGAPDDLTRAMDRIGAWTP
ncbi:MAG: aminotransferase class I/II-fold pyridoxal phosphate-dependent enzyme [Actinomycetia bacterium]|nr:aminotransferase class I/II-fold pyridoxal phosphate-dependent enzyme [Actinomycetes bacterium]MCP4228274.1 aminotransferase class I/II-fold pyridoxal phosphate-dependent enzyme [Actinomycetes bacterium]MCP5031179.1 aminotransferase class I/II-fold pyridoxal phosphate-dependent enzyme [Actinomycetes bacterium]